ncbi:tyrosine-type recombinase/integrase [Spongisporangium articulatum]|uniref:Tyrosine-type recombinase/integrase n=1 Tax=Spongisporangium articulatum TaxID=3362603 RepID=A0ABW8AJW0_9ACTN
MPSKRRFGRVRKLPSGRWQARYLGPDGIDRPAPETFSNKTDATIWLADREAELRTGEWIDPEAGRTTLGDFAARWVKERPGLTPKTKQLYEGLVRLHIRPGLGDLPLADLTPARVRTWRATLLDGGLGPVTVAKAYRLLRTIMQTAVDDRVIRSNPCQIKGASVERSPERPVLTVPEVYSIADAMPDRFRLMILLATFCSLRFGELGALTRGAVDVDKGLLHVRRSLVELGDGSLIFKEPKTTAGRRVVGIPGAMLADVIAHLDEFTGDRPDAFVFVGPKGATLRRSNFQKYWRNALQAAGIEGVHFHDLRHTGNTLVAQSGATLPDLMARMGHASTRAALIYIHTNSTRDRLIADRLSELIPASDRARNGHDKPTSEEEGSRDDRSEPA